MFSCPLNMFLVIMTKFNHCIQIPFYFSICSKPRFHYHVNCMLCTGVVTGSTRAPPPPPVDRRVKTGKQDLFKPIHITNTPVTLIPNQQESSRTSRNEEFSKFAPHSGGNFKPSHTWGGMEIIYIFLDMRFGGVLNYVRTHSRANRDVPTVFEPHSSGNRNIPTTFELHSSWILVISK